MAVFVQEPDAELFPAVTLDDWATHTFVLRRTEVEPDLFATKWWDYRFMTPFEATMAFVEDFAVEGRKLYARDLDFERAQHIRFPSSVSIMAGLRQNDKKTRQVFSEFWRARQVADAAGIPYGIYVAEAMNQRLRAWQRGYLPKPGHLYRDRDVERVVARWEELEASRVYYATHHAYMAQNYIGAPMQDDYYTWLVERSARTGNRVQTLRDMLDADRLAPEFLQRFDAGIYERVTTP